MQKFFLLFVLLWSLSIYSQKEYIYEYADTQLEDVIEDVQKKYSIVFSFAQDVVASKKITLSIKDISLDELLIILEAQTALEFNKISENQIVIAPIKRTDELCGFLLDSATKTPIAYTTIMLNSSLQSQTDAKGFFSFKNVESSERTLKVIGYNSLDLSPSHACGPIYLDQKVEELKEVVITGYVTSGIDKRKDGSIEISQKNLGILPGLISPDLLQSIQLVPGIASLDESSTGLQIRGGASDQNLILFDGIQLFNSGYLYGMFSLFNPNATKSATIFKAGASVKYGDRISGIIDIKTEDLIPDEPELGFGFDGLSLDAYIKTPLSKKTALYFFGRSSYTGIYKSATYDAFAEKIFRNFGEFEDANGNIVAPLNDDEFDINSSANEFSFYDLNAKVVHRPDDKNLISISSIFTSNSLDFSFGTNEVRLDSTNTKNGGISLKWEHRSSQNQLISLRSYFSRYDYHYQNLEVFSGNILEEKNIRSNQINDFGFEFSSRRSFLNNHSLFTGYQLSNTDLSIDISKEKPFEPQDNFSDPAEQSNLKNVLFGEYVFNLKNSGVFIGGARFVHYSSVGELFFEPRLNFEYPISNKVRIKASFEKRNQPISQLVEFNQTELRQENNLWRLSDGVEYPLLNSQQISSGILYDHSGLTFDFDFYRKKIGGLTSFTNGFSNPQLILSNGESSISGLDLLLKKRLKNYRIWIGYSYNDIRFTFPEISDEDFPGNNDITHNFRISNTLKTKNLEFSLGWIYRTGEPFTPLANYNQGDSTFELGDINSGRLLNYHRLDASITYRKLINPEKKYRLLVGFSAINIYDRKVPLSITYIANEEVQGSLDQVIQRFSLGFTPNFSVRLFL